MTASLLERVAERLEQRTDPSPSPALQRFPTPGHLARHVRPDTVQTPMLDAVDAAVVQAARGEHRYWIINTPPQEGKLVADTTPVPTPQGWTNHGDLRAGDRVLHPSGHPVRVTEVHPQAQASYLVRTSDYAEIVVHPRHEWTVWDRDTKQWRTVETEYLANARLSDGVPGKRGHRYRFQLPYRESLVAPDSTLPVEPYTLGVWLGDGSTRRASITHHPDDTYELDYPSTSSHVHKGTGIVSTYYGGGFTRDLRAAGVWGNKHIPAAYLRASETQRRALLAGLIDTDGHVAKIGQVSFDNANRNLVNQVAELLRTLGYRAHVHRPTAPKLSSSGIQGKQEMWRVTYTPHDRGPARLPRKAATKLGMRRRSAIMSVAPTTPVPGRCISVDAPDGLYLIGEHFTPTHNSTRLQAAALWLLLDDPTRRIVFASYEQGLAQVSGLAVRQMIETFGSGYQGAAADPDREDGLGLGLDPSRGAATAWRLAQTSRVPSPGGVVSVGVGSALTGRPADVLIVDDPIKDAAHADSKKIRKNLKDWWESVASTRLAPDAIVIVVSTRWHEDDLAGWLLSEDDPAVPKWAHLSISVQALAEDLNAKPPIGPDPLGREPGEWMVSARGRTVADWEQKRKDIGRGGRWWNAMYQQRPAPPEGGIFQREWFRRDRIHTLPELRKVVVMVDPADNTGDGDEAGIIVGGTDHHGHHVLIADYSGHYTTDGWFRRAYMACLDHEAAQLQWEVSLSGLKRTAASTWKSMLKEARHLVEAWREGPGGDRFPDPSQGDADPDVIALAVANIAGPEDSAADRKVQAARLLELWPYVNRIRALPSTGPYVKKPVRAVVSKLLRAELVAPLYENREVSHLGYRLSTLEHEMATWQDGQKSPNRMDAAVHLLRELSRSDGATTVQAAQGSVPRHLGVGAQLPTIGRSSTPRR